MTGVHVGTTDFDPGPGAVTATSANNSAFVAKVNANGDLVWAKTMVGSDVDASSDGMGIAVDAAGNVYIGGNFEGTVDFDPGAATHNLTALVVNGENDIFISKLDANGDFLWAKSIGDINHQTLSGLKVDAAGNVYFTGLFNGTVDFDPGPGTAVLTAAGGPNMCVGKLDSNGDFIWAKQIGATTTISQLIRSLDLALDASGNVYTTGTFNVGSGGTIDFDPGPGVFGVTQPSPNTDIFVLKLTTDGTFDFVKTIVQGSNLSGNGITVASSGNIYVTGQFAGSIDFDPGPGVENLVSTGLADPFVLKLDAGGNYVWAKNFTGGSSSRIDSGSKITVDASEDVYTSGIYFSSTNDFDPGPGTFILSGMSNHTSTFISKLDVNGNFVWALGFRGADFNFPGAVRVQPSGDIYMAGYFNTSMDADPGPCLNNLTSTNDYYDIFVEKIRLGTPPPEPTFTSFSPASGPVGTTVTLTGTNFNTTPSENQVYFYVSRPATVTAATETSLTVTVPSGTTTGPIYVISNCVGLVSSTNFTVGVGIPTITSFTPTSGVFEETVTITGTNFSTTPAANTVRFNGELATVSASTTTTITTTVPVGATTGKITVRVGSNTATSAADFTVTCVEPEITGFSPISGLPGDEITIIGSNFNTTASENILDFNGVPAVATASTSTTITTTVPAGAITGPISVFNGCYGTTSDFAFTIGCGGPEPSMYDISPTTGVVGTIVTISGVNFSTIANDNLVFFNGVRALVTSSTETTIVAQVPPGATPGDISLQVGCNHSGSDTDPHFEVYAILAITTHPADVVICDGDNATLHVEATGASNIAYQWSYSPDGVGGFESFTDMPGVTGSATSTLTVNSASALANGYFRCEINGDLAEEVESNVASIMIAPGPAAPGTTSSSRCGNGSVVLSANGGADGQYRWYSEPTGGTAIIGEVSDSFTTPSLLATTDYYVSINNGTCESNRTPVTATIIPVPAAPSVTGASACAGTTFTLNAAGGTDGQYKWYNHATDIAALTGETNGSYTTPALTETTVYYVTLTINGCESSRTPVTATVVSNGCAPEISAASLATQPEGVIVIDLKPLITTTGTLDVSSIKVVQGPPSGAHTSVEEGILTIDYSGVPFGGLESITVEACNTNGHCGQQEFTIEVAGDIVVYNGLSPNGDGKNETLILQFIDALPAAKTNRVSIYNRWGNEVFSVTDYDNNTRVFTGRSSNGGQLPAGTYYYKIHFPLQNRTVTGFLSLKN